jgi:hypothetical protein
VIGHHYTVRHGSRVAGAHRARHREPFGHSPWQKEAHELAVNEISSVIHGDYKREAYACNRVGSALSLSRGKPLNRTAKVARYW